MNNTLTKSSDFILHGFSDIDSNAMFHKVYTLQNPQISFYMDFRMLTEGVIVMIDIQLEHIVFFWQKLNFLEL